MSMPAWLQQVDNPVADAYALGYQAGEETARPKWIRADPDKPETWPEDGTLVFAHVRFPDVSTVTRAKAGHNRFHEQTIGALTIGPNTVLHWMPWAAIGDPSL